MRNTFIKIREMWDYLAAYWRAFVSHSYLNKESTGKFWSIEPTPTGSYLILENGKRVMGNYPTMEEAIKHIPRNSTRRVGFE
jgi:hypothetical protein